MRHAILWAGLAVFALACGGDQLRAVGGAGGSGGGDAPIGCEACAPEATCAPGPVCVCKPGFEGDGLTCADVDECAAAPCDPRAVCENLPGSHACTCPPPLEGDGTVCRADDEFGAPIVLDELGHEASRAAVAAAGADVFVAWRSGDEVKAVRWLGISNRFESAHTLHGAHPIAAGQRPLVAAAGGGSAVAAWVDEAASVVLSRFDPAAQRWSAPEVLGDPGTEVRLAGLSLDEAGNVSLAWTLFDPASGWWVNEARAFFVSTRRWTDRIYIGLSREPSFRSASFTSREAQVLRQRFYYEAANGKPSSALLEFALASGKAYLLNGQYLDFPAAQPGSGRVAFEPTGRAWAAWVAADGVAVRGTTGTDEWGETTRLHGGYDLAFDLAAGEGAAIASTSSEGSALSTRKEGDWKQAEPGGEGMPRGNERPSIALRRGLPLVAWVAGDPGASSVHVSEALQDGGHTIRVIAAADETWHHGAPEIASSGAGELVVWLRTDAGGASELLASTRH